MRIVCEKCGADLQKYGTREMVICGGCGQYVKGIEAHGGNTAAGQSASGSFGRVMVVVVAAAFVAIGGAIVSVPDLRQRVFGPTEPPRRPPPATPLVPVPYAGQTPSVPLRIAAPPVTAPVIEPFQPRPIAGDEPPGASPPGQGRPRTGSGRAPKPEPSTPVVSKAEAEAALKPEILSCMRQNRVHYLITRIGQGYGKRQSGTLPALRIVETAYVDYRPVPGFAKTPLGRCVSAAASQIRCSAFRGNYIYFGLRNNTVPDPLAGQPESLDHGAAKQALTALDEEARDCARRAPSGSKPGETVRVSVTFTGFDGRVKKVEPIYVKAKSDYAKCLKSVYKKAQVPRFRRLDDRTMHALAP